MGLKDEIDAEVAEVLLGELREALSEFQGERKVNTITKDDWISGSNSAVTVTYSGKGVFTDYSSREIDDNIIEATDTKLICLQSHLSNTPQRDDLINGYRVVNINKDPLDVSYEIQLRKV